MENEITVFVLQTKRLPADRSMEYLKRDFMENLGSRNPDFIVMPEKWVIDILDEDSGKLEEIMGFFSDITSESGGTAIPGSFSVRRGDGVYNSSPVIIGGKTAGWQDKITLFNAEKGNYVPGSEMNIFDAGGLKFSVSICYDSDFPYYSRLAAMKGSEIMLNPALIHGEFHDMWKIYIEARTLENRLPFVSVNSLSDPFLGNSMISVPERYKFGAKLNTRILGNREDAFESINIDGLREMRKARLDEDPGSYSLGKDKFVDQR